MEVASFREKLNKVDGKIYVIEEEVVMPESGIYEAELQHDNIGESTLTVYTGPKLTGDRIQTYSLSTPSITPWKRIIRIQTAVPVVYICYETDGDTVEAEDVNRLQEVVVKTQQAVNNHLNDEENPHKVTAKQVGLDQVENKSGKTIRSEMTKEEVVKALGFTPAEGTATYTHPESGVAAGTYKSVTVDAQGHVTAGSNPNTLEGYGITDALKKNSVTWDDLKGVTTA